MDTLDKILELMEQQHCDHQMLASALGLNRQVVTDWKAHRSQSYRKYLYQIADILNVQVTDLLNGEEDLPPQKNAIRIPVYNSLSCKDIEPLRQMIPPLHPVISTDTPLPPLPDAVAAGLPFDSTISVESYAELEKDGIKGGEYVALVIHGDSMEPRMMEGDVVILRVQTTVKSGDTAVLFIGGDPAICRRVKLLENGIMLIPTNPNYEPMLYTDRQIRELPIRIFGKVVELRAKY